MHHTVVEKAVLSQRGRILAQQLTIEDEADVTVGIQLNGEVLSVGINSIIITEPVIY